MGSEKLGMCDHWHYLNPHPHYSNCVNFREQPRGEATGKPPEPSPRVSAQTEGGEKPGLGSVLRHIPGDPLTPKCNCEEGGECWCEPSSPPATTGTAREFLDNYQDAWVLSISERGKNTIAAVCEAYAAQKVSQGLEGEHEHNE